MRPLPSLILATWLVAGTAAPAFAQLDCIVPTLERSSGSGLTLRSPALAPIRAAALAVEAVVKRNAVFMAGARPVRVRTKIEYSHDEPWTANVYTGVYNETAWLGRCDLSPFADRGGGLRDGTLLVTLNEPRTLLGNPVGGDAELEAFEAPALVGRVAGFPEYAHALGTFVMLSDTGTAPWIPVTIAEALDVEERRLREMHREWARREARYPGQDAGTGDALAAQVEDLRVYRASFSARQLQGPASPNGRRPSGITRVDDQSGRALVKVDPAYRRLDPNRVHLIFVARTVGPAADPVPGRHSWMQRAVDRLDYAALAALLK